HDLLLELTGTVVLHGDAGALGEQVEGVLQLVGLLLTDRAEQGDGLAVERAVLLERFTFGADVTVAIGGAVIATTSAASPEVVSTTTAAHHRPERGHPRHYGKPPWLPNSHRVLLIADRC